MILFPYVTPVFAALTLSLLARHATIHSTPESTGRAAMVQGTGGPNIGCAPTRAASVAIPFERVDLGSAGLPQGGDDLLLGPRLLVVLNDSTQWPAVWRAAVAPSAWTRDTIPVPTVAFGKGALVLVATRTYGWGRVRLRVTSIRQCRRSGIVVVTATQTTPRGAGEAVRSRGFDVVRVPNRQLDDPVIFEDRFQNPP